MDMILYVNLRASVLEPIAGSVMIHAMVIKHVTAVSILETFLLGMVAVLDIKPATEPHRLQQKLL